MHYLCQIKAKMQKQNKTLTFYPESATYEATRVAKPYLAAGGAGGVEFERHFRALHA